MIYLDAKTGRAMAKRFNVTSITRDKEYDLTTAAKGNKVLYFAAYPNGETEKYKSNFPPDVKPKRNYLSLTFQIWKSKDVDQKETLSLNIL